MREKLLPVGRALWVIWILVIIAMWAGGLVVLMRAPVSDCLNQPCDPSDINMADIEVAREMGVPGAESGWLLIVAGYNIPIALLYFASGAVIFFRKSDDWTGLLVSMCLVFLGGLLFTSTDDALVRAYPGLSALREYLIPFGMGLFITLFFVFPDGRITPRWLWWPGLFFFVSYSLVEYLIPGANSVNPVWLALFFPMIIFAQVYRYLRVSTQTEKQQTKWAVIGLLGALALMITWTVLENLYPPSRSEPARIYALAVALPLLMVFALLLPLTFAFSILRYRLWDIDFLIRRTLSYAVLTGLLGLVYFGVVVVLQNVFVDLTGQRSQAAIVISTLVIAALFSPLRTRIQEFIDRSFYRQKYDMAQTIEAFALEVRDDVDMDRLNAALLRVITDTMRPEGVSLWLNTGGRGTRGRDQ